MSVSDLNKKKLSRETMLAKVEDVLKRGKQVDAPAYTLILGAGASFGVVPTAKEMLGFPDAVTKKVHEKSIPIWLANQIDSDVKLDSDFARLECSKAFWKHFRAVNAGNDKCKGIEIDLDGLPKMASIAVAYQSVFDTGCIGGLNTPERHRNYMRAVTMAAEPGSTQLNATHFYLASLLSLQKRPGDLGSDKKTLYTGRREFARTIFTTNFDPLLQTSLQLFQLLYYMTDRPEFLSADALQTDHHPAMHLFYAHGSVHRPYMANTDEQIALLKQQNARDLAAYLGNHGVIVLGYSGWDDCLLEALNQTKTFSNNLYWLARGANSISDEVARGEIEKEIADYTTVIETAKAPVARVAKARFNRGIRYGDRGEIEKEIADYTAIIEMSGLPVDQVSKARVNRGVCYVEKGEVDKAVADYTAVIEMADAPIDQVARARVNRGVRYGEKGETEKEIADYTVIIEMSGAPIDQVAKAQFNRGVCYVNKGEADKAMADFTSVIEMTGAPIDIVERTKTLLTELKPKPSP